MAVLYTFIARKPSSADYCRGCLMASYNDDFVSETFATKEQLAEKWAKYLLMNKRLRIHEHGYDFYVYRNGRQVFNSERSTIGPYIDWIYDEAEDDREAAETEVQQGQDEITVIYAAALEIANKQFQEEEEQKKQALLKEQQAKAEKEAAARRVQYEKLKLEFEQDKALHT